MCNEARFSAACRALEQKRHAIAVGGSEGFALVALREVEGGLSPLRCVYCLHCAYSAAASCFIARSRRTFPAWNEDRVDEKDSTQDNRNAGAKAHIVEELRADPGRPCSSGP